MKLFKSESALETLLRIVFAFCVVGTLFQVLGLALTYGSTPQDFGAYEVQVPIQDQNRFLESFSENGESRSVRPGIEYNSVIVKGDIENASVATMLVHKLPPIFATAIVALIAWFLLRIVYRSYEGRLFSNKTVVDIRVVAFAIAAMFVGQVIFSQLQITTLQNAGFYSFSYVTYSIDIYKIVFGVVIILLGLFTANAVKNATSMKEELDGTV